MGIGYIVGCLASIVMWKIDRQYLFYKFDNMLKKITSNKYILQIIYIFLIMLIVFLMHTIKHLELSNAITSFLVIDISNTEKKNLSQREKVKFYESISTISRAVVCGFIAPLMLIIVFGNVFGILYMLLYNISFVNEDLNLIKVTFIALTIIPSIITEIFLYIVYFCRNKKSQIDFKGDYIINTFLRPLLNVDILGAYIESVNFYFLYNFKNTDYLKSYGKYTKKIDDICVKDYLSIAYGICLIFYIIFFYLIRK
ncbi:hypothetical protein SAMN05428976_1015 [Clostridium sp. USBA 49]|jgi:hypothetical protein|uniref:hypothetical protein n=1 Tax=Clostridium TaxID=1485 RepID=UPI00099A2D53|nr:MULTISPECIES: hypothetical protein [Clostridium]SKA72630.1 hypothetical protein SAMN05428976_1015 [Clostridium sp. USBA 49]